MKTLLLAATFLFFCVDNAHSAAAPEVTCGATLSHRSFTLSADLNCSTATAPITLRDRAQLDVNGHTLKSQVVLDGRQAQLKNGKVICSNEEGCAILQGVGRHLLENVLVQAAEGTFIIVVTSDNNSLIGNTAFNGSGEGFDINGNNNILRGNIALFSGQVAFDIDGDGNQLSHNSSTGIHLLSFIVAGNNNIVVQNTASDQFGDFKFIILGDGNRISRNVVFVDFPSLAPAFSVEATGQNNLISDNLAPNLSVRDLNANCDNNTWTGNIFGTANQACIQ